MVGKKKMLAESLKEMVWGEFEQKLKESSAEQKGLLFTETNAEKNAPTRGTEKPPVNLSEIPPKAFTQASLGAPKKEDKDKLIRFVRGLEGVSAVEKLTSLSKYLATPPKPKTEADVSNFISYVNATKTLASIITDFSPSSGGFLYEAFLAACLEGEQVSREKIIIDGKKLTNIADIKINDEYYGIKFNKSGVVTGSFRNLIATLLEHESITYLTSIKKITGEGLGIEGTVTTYQVPINKSNVAGLLQNADNPTNMSSIRTPQDSFLRDLGSPNPTHSDIVDAIQETLETNDPKAADEKIWGSKNTKGNVLTEFDFEKIKTTYGWQRKGKFRFNKTQMQRAATRTKDGDSAATIEIRIGKGAIEKNIQDYLKVTEKGYDKIFSQATDVLKTLSLLTDKTHDYTTNGFNNGLGKDAVKLSEELTSSTEQLVKLVANPDTASP
mgnify:CR=1 FL=1